MTEHYCDKCNLKQTEGELSTMSFKTPGQLDNYIAELCSNCTFLVSRFALEAIPLTK